MFFLNFTFLQTEGHLCKLFFIDWYNKDLISVVLLSVSKIQNKKSFCTFMICFHMNTEK